MPQIILNVEDDDSAYELLRMAFEDVGSSVELHRVEDGVAALKFLRRMEPFKSSPRPHLILLNINLPRLNGLEVLAELHKDDVLKDIPAVVFSSSSLDSERAQCLAMGAKHFITKPTDFEGLIIAVQTACGYASL